MKRKRKRSTESAPPTLLHLLDFPASTISTAPQLELSGNREAVVESCTGILEYNDHVIHLSANKMSIRFTGRDLTIRVMTQSSAIIEGFITTIELIT